MRSIKRKEEVKYIYQEAQKGANVGDTSVICSQQLIDFKIC
jgi:hypothetical protein